VWADLGAPTRRRPVCAVTREAAIGVLSAVTCAPIARAVRGIRSAIAAGRDEELPDASVITCDNTVTLPTTMLTEVPVGCLGLEKRAASDRALRYVSTSSTEQLST
jgi:mRNA interferase MazF